MPREIAERRKSGAIFGAKFHEVGATLSGYLLGNPVEQQANDLDTGKPKFWDNGDPAMQWIYDLKLVSETKCSEHCNWCAQAKPKTDADPGTRRIYANYSQNKAIQNAIYRNDPPELYGLLTLKFKANDLDKKKPGKAAPKLWEATYRIPTDAEVDEIDKFLGIGAYAPKPVVVSDFGDLLEDYAPGKMSLADMLEFNE